MSRKPRYERFSEGGRGLIIRRARPRCACGSGKPSIPQFDADGRYVCHACENCYQREMSKRRKGR